MKDNVIVKGLKGRVDELWAGGAEAMSVMGQRALGTTAIRLEVPANEGGVSLRVARPESGDNG